ncbi:MAG: ribosomal protein S18-alanine N-acetyltransferase [Dehalococcoidia bacterium]
MFQIIEAAINHADCISNLEKKFFGKNDVSYQDVLLNYKLNNYIVYIAKFDSECIGYLSASLVCFELNIYNLGIEEKYRKKGYGYQLLDYTIKSIPNISNVYVELRKSNSAALNLYKKLGFYIYNQRSKYYSMPNEDAFLMQYSKKYK